jgi:excisionase family DNA binding protein
VRAPGSHEGDIWTSRANMGIEPHVAAFDRCFSVDQTALILGTSSATVRRLVATGRLAHQRVSARRIVIRESALRTYLDAVSNGPRP